MANNELILELKVSKLLYQQPDNIGSFSSGATTFLVVKNETKKTFEVFLVQYMPHRYCSTAFVSQHIWKWLTEFYPTEPCTVFCAGQW